MRPYLRTHGPGNRSWMVVLLVVGAAGLVMVCAFCALAGFLLSRPRQPGPDTGSRETPREATVEFLDQLRAGNVRTAYDFLCSDTRERFSSSEFERLVAEKGTLTGYEIGAIDQDTEAFGGRPFTARVSVTLRYATGTVEQRVIRNVDADYEDDVWQVCGDPY